MVCVVHRSRSTMAVGIEQILHDRGRCNLAGADRRMIWRTMTVTAALKGHLLLSFEVVSFNTLMDSCTPSTRARCQRWQLTCTLFMDLAVRRLVGTVMSFFEAKGGAFTEATPTQVGTLIQPEYLYSLGIWVVAESRPQHVCLKCFFSPRPWYSHCFIWEGCWNKGMEACFENLLLCTAADTRAQQYHGRCFGRSTWAVGLDLNLLKNSLGSITDGSHIFPFFASYLPVKKICMNMFA